MIIMIIIHNTNSTNNANSKSNSSTNNASSNSDAEEVLRRQGLRVLRRAAGVEGAARG